MRQNSADCQQKVVLGVCGSAVDRSSLCTSNRDAPDSGHVSKLLIVLYARSEHLHRRRRHALGVVVVDGY